MAYMTKDGKGPYPNKAGEYCGNHLPGGKPLRDLTRDPARQAEEHKAYMATVRFGRPHACGAGTTKEMEAMGYVGLYLKADSSVQMPDEIDVPAPAELMEPEN